MERSAHFALVGVLTTCLILFGLVFVIWLGGFSHVDQDHYQVVFKGPVSGLSEGGQVLFNGIKVGEIEHVDLVPRDATLIGVDVKIRKGIPVRADSVATSAMQGISGVDAVAISAGSVNQPLLKDTTRSDRPIIQGQKSGLASLIDNGGKTVQAANEALVRVNKLLSDRNIAELSMTLNDVHSVTAALAANKAIIPHAAALIAKLDRTASDIDAATTSAHGLINGDGRRAVRNIADAGDDLKVTLRNADALIASLHGSADSIGPTLNATLDKIQRASDSLDILLRQLRTDPRGTLGKSPGKELELPQ